MPTRAVPTAEFKRRLSEYLARVAYNKETVVITRRGRPVAQLSPVEEGPSHLSEVRGWLDEDDPFFEIIEEIVRAREDHVPRIWKSR